MIETERSVIGGDVALRQITLTTCCTDRPSPLLTDRSVVFARRCQCAPRLTHGFLDSHESASKTTSRSVQPFCMAHLCAQHTETTERATRAIDRMYTMHSMRIHNYSCLSVSLSLSPIRFTLHGRDDHGNGIPSKNRNPIGIGTRFQLGNGNGKEWE